MPCNRLCDKIMKESSDEMQGGSWGSGQIRGRCRRLVSLIDYCRLSHWPHVTSQNSKVSSEDGHRAASWRYHGQVSVFGSRTDTLS